MSGIGVERRSVRWAAWLPPLLFAVVAVAGLEYVKWQPYAERAVVAAARHGIGPSILGGADGTTPLVGWRAGLDYAASYGRAVWKALVLALLLGAGVQVLLSRRLVRRVFAGRGARMRAAGAALPAMMCSCCATPITIGLIRGEADRAAAIAWWLANLVLNPATILFIGLVLGWEWAALRLGLGLALVFGLSAAAARLMPAGSTVPAPPTIGDEARSGLARAYGAALWRLTVRLVPAR